MKHKNSSKNIENKTNSENETGKKQRSFFNRKKALEMAKEMGQKAMNDPEKVASIEKRLPSMIRGPIVKIKDEVSALWNAFKSPDVPLYMKIAIIGALAYLVSPIDLIPDAIPVTGLLDDAAVIISTVKILHGIVKKSAPLIKENIKKITVEKIDNVLKPKIKTFEERKIQTSLIKLSMFTAGSILLEVFPKNALAFYGAAILILSSLAWTVTKWIKNIVKSRKRIVDYSKLWFKNKCNFDNTAKAVIEYELENYQTKKQQEKGKTKKSTGQNFVTFLVRQWNRDKLLKDFIPNYDELKNLLVPHYIKTYIFHIVIFIGYLLLTIFMLKPFLLSLSGTNITEIYSLLNPSGIFHR